MKFFIKKSIVAVAFALLTTVILCSCRKLTPTYPKEWPATIPISAVDELTGSYNNHCADYTFDDTAAKSYRPTLDHVLNLNKEYDAKSVNITKTNGDELVLTFNIPKEGTSDTVCLKKADGWKLQDGKLFKQEVSYNYEGCDGGGRFKSEISLYKTEDGGLIIKTRNIFTGIIYFIPILRDDVTQWTWFKLTVPPSSSLPQKE